MTPDAINRLVAQLARLPGIGEKTAQRLAFHILRSPPEYARGLAAALTEVVDRVKLCGRCFSLHDGPEGTFCGFCSDPRRDDKIVCVVEGIADELAIERTREFRGRYHVLGGAISPIEGIGPDDLRVKELMTRLADGTITELIIATDPNLEGEATATYLARLVKPMGLAVTRLASGLPVGGDLEYADEVTLGRAFEGRRRLDV
jgi:recombination protein RecR